MAESNPESVLVTGGAGYIGSHTVLQLIEAGFKPIVVDNYANSVRGNFVGRNIPESLLRVEQLTNSVIEFYEVDLRNKDEIRDIFRKCHIDFVLHFAGLKAVGESCEIPLLYYEANLSGAVHLLEVMEEFNVCKIAFSSSATVYGDIQYLPLDEKHPVGHCACPYGKTKYFVEEILKDAASANKALSVVILRYFNPVGAHPSGLIGEDPQGPPNNLMPYVAQVAVGRLPELSVFGNDYDTPDGTGVRDYIHVVDLAIGHVAALKKLSESTGCTVYNLGTGKGYSVLEMIAAFEKASGKRVSYKICPRRTGDLPTVYGDPSLAEKELGWKAVRGIEDMCRDLWQFQSKNPKGYAVSTEGTGDTKAEDAK